MCNTYLVDLILERLMFLKKMNRDKDGKSHRYWALVESYRTARGPRHRTVAYLGELADSEQKGWASLSHRLGGTVERFAQFELFAGESETEPVPENVVVNVRGVQVEKTTDFGNVYLGLLLWQTLGLDELFRKILPDGRTGGVPRDKIRLAGETDISPDGESRARTYLGGVPRLCDVEDIAEVDGDCGPGTRCEESA
jgi:hypothetical protein